MAKNTHLEHLEDDILNQGSKGGRNSIAFLRELVKMLSQPTSSVKVTTKWDGAPAIICGINPEYNKFFVGTKGVFAKNSKACYSEGDVDYFYPQGGQLADKLKAALKYLSKLPIRGVIQGDLLFTDDVTSTIIGGERVLSFQPNTIVYAVPEKSDLGNKVKRAKLGIVFHTSYSGPTLSEMDASFGVDVSKLQGDPNVVVFSSDFEDVSGKASLSSVEKNQVNSLINRSEGSLKQASKFLDVLASTGDGKFLMSTLFKQYFNSYIRAGKPIKNARKVVSEYSLYYKSILDKEIQTKKTTAAQNKYKKIQQDGLNFIKQNQNAIYFTVASYMNIIQSKEYIIRKLERVKTLGTFLKTEDGYKVTAPEGFVAIKSGSALKLVDRLEFSRANFTADKNWDKP